MQIERRSVPRRKIQLSALIAREYGDPFGCQISDLSLVGARIEASDLALPNNFIVVMKLNSNVPRECRVVWRAGYAVGVSFQH